MQTEPTRLQGENTSLEISIRPEREADRLNVQLRIGSIIAVVHTDTLQFSAFVRRLQAAALEVSPELQKQQGTRRWWQRALAKAQGGK